LREAIELVENSKWCKNTFRVHCGEKSFKVLKKSKIEF
jgi:hypothetical protein